MWGTDWPVCKQWTTYEDTVRVVRDDMPFLNAEDKSWIMSRTVQRIWSFAH
jgi:predicted TIM-barrel fold metal-dependent hydrolase